MYQVIIVSLSNSPQVCSITIFIIESLSIVLLLANKEEKGSNSCFSRAINNFKSISRTVSICGITIISIWLSTRQGIQPLTAQPVPRMIQLIGLSLFLFAITLEIFLIFVEIIFSIIWRSNRKLEPTNKDNKKKLNKIQYQKNEGKKNKVRNPSNESINSS